MIRIKNIIEVENYLDVADVFIFDLDDTLYSEKEYIKSGFSALANAYPGIKDFASRLWNAFLNGEKKPIDYVLAQEGLLLEKEKCLEIYRSHTPSIHFYPGVEEMIDKIKKTKKIAIITDGRPYSQKAKLFALGLSNELAIITDELGGICFRKPCEKAFTLIKDHFPTVPYDRMAYVGDNLTKDFIAPDKLGMVTIYFQNKEGLYYNKHY